MASDFQKRDVTLLRDTLSLICHTIWNSGKPPDGKHLWSIPPDRERDFDYILSDGITELVHLREENARLRAAREWQPIETAPKDGTPVLVALIGRHGVAYRCDQLADPLLFLADDFDDTLGPAMKARVQAALRPGAATEET